MKTYDNKTQEIIAAADTLVNAFYHNDKMAYFGCFTPDATFILYNFPVTLLSRNDYLKQWTVWQESGFSIVDCISRNKHIHLQGNTAIFHHEVETTVLNNEEKQVLHERETIVFTHTLEGWLACHEHLSAYDDHSI